MIPFPPVELRGRRLPNNKLDNWENPMKRILLATAASALLATVSVTAATAEPVNLGIILGFTGPLESITPGMAASA